MTFDKLPNSYKLTVLALVLLAAPLTFFSFFFGGPYVGALIVVLLMLAMMVLYMVGVRMGWRK
jgi:hypothetical protein